ncbi:KilA-N domain-containing protein [Roseomonas chloroacetimidivorans]|uniref:KilA-N domain-containing protein n=1 Tax=Roseomonas chloroacetimidivorans TaxID=1766656 RepID=UPI003C77075A
MSTQDIGGSTPRGQQEPFQMIPVQGGYQYGATLIHERGEMLSLTEMWKAAGGDPSRRPAEWLRSADAKNFIGFLAGTLNVEISHIGLVRTDRGGQEPGTWAHWQIAMAYAQYLSPEFRAACNTIVRAHMEGQTASTLAPEGAVLRTTIRRASLREVAVALDAGLRIASRFGIRGNQALLMASRATERHIGVNPMEMMGIPMLEAPEAEMHLNASDIGKQIGGQSGRNVNRMLKAKGLQSDSRDAKGNIVWEPTEAGQRYAVMVDVGKKQGDGTPVRQLRWRSGVVALLKGESH